MQDGSDSRGSPLPSGAHPSWLEVEVVEDAGDWSSLSPVEGLVAAAAAALAAHPRFAGEAAATACLALSDDAAVRALNKSYRGKDKATNVLSFPAPETAAREDSGGARSLGDVVLAVETVAREAEEQAIAPAGHFQHLVVHGLLHLLGFDHETETEALEMERLEVEILAALGIEDPYHDTEPVAALSTQ